MWVHHPRNHVLDGGQDQMNPFTAVRIDNRMMQPFAKVIWILISICYSFPYRIFHPLSQIKDTPSNSRHQQGHLLCKDSSHPCSGSIANSH